MKRGVEEGFFFSLWHSRGFEDRWSYRNDWIERKCQAESIRRGPDVGGRWEYLKK